MKVTGPDPNSRVGVGWSVDNTTHSATDTYVMVCTEEKPAKTVVEVFVGNQTLNITGEDLFAPQKGKFLAHLCCAHGELF